MTNKKDDHTLFHAIFHGFLWLFFLFFFFVLMWTNSDKNASNVICTTEIYILNEWENCWDVNGNPKNGMKVNEPNRNEFFSRCRCKYVYRCRRLCYEPKYCFINFIHLNYSREIYLKVKTITLLCKTLWSHRKLFLDNVKRAESLYICIMEKMRVEVKKIAGWLLADDGFEK